MKDLKFGDAGTAHVLAEPGLFFEEFWREGFAIGRRDPAVAFAEHADEVGEVGLMLAGGLAA
jgi:hypothetical protein